MKQMRAIGILMSLGALVVTACSSDNDPTAKSITVNGTGGSSSAPSTGGTAAILPDAGNADASDDAAMPAESPSIQGNYNDDYGGQVQITSDTWYSDYFDSSLNMETSFVFHLRIVDNTEKFAIALNDSIKAYNANLWSRFDWATDSNGILRYCQTVYDAATEQLALETARANAQNFDHGCGQTQSPWTKLTPIQTSDAGADAGP